MELIKSLVSLMLPGVGLVSSFFNFNSDSVNKRAINRDPKDKSQLRIIITSCFSFKIKHDSYLLKIVQ